MSLLNVVIKLRDLILGVSKNQTLLHKSLENDKEISFRIKEIKAMEVLKPYFPDSYLFETSYSISFQTLQHLANDIVVYRPKTILEIGSGLSTIIINNLLKELNYDVKFFSVDQDLGWQKTLSKTCDLVLFKHFDLINSNSFSFDGTGTWFDIPSNSELLSMKFDLILVDGPKGHESKFARYGIVNFISDRLNPNSIMYIDDTHREDEDLIVSDLVKRMDLKIVNRGYNYCRLSFVDNINTKPF
ncbi:class I SAM-dependent methyltransferase [Litoribacter populi]|uniref:class I SAM-dependent methyltransferase n=1 Tax=Litoribacter populi TaxID=2598460 RepID=UPI00117F4536|nr:class I SAM-dependent methyltransferase [Litoribacter populi]